MSLLASARHIKPAQRLTPLLRRNNSSASVSPLYPHAPVYSYAMGLSYAAKYSPPFISTKQEIKPYGLDQKEDEVGEWVREMLDLNAGRGDIRASLQEIKEVRRKYGAGEDFFGMTSARGDLHLVVSDGVGGWSETLDASLFPQLLCYYYTKAVRDLSMSTTGSVDPKSILKKAYEDALADKRVLGGGATMVSARLDEDGQGVFSNMGDSGYLILRGNEIFEISKPQTHFFNCPKALSKIPVELRHKQLIHDDPSVADMKSFALKAGDTIALYTDGFSDNVPTSHIPSLSTLLNRILDDPANAGLSPSERASERARLFADMLVGYGRSAMQRTGEEKGANDWKTPFEEEAAIAQPRWKWKGGKYDDITVMTAVVTEVDS
ncbi:hypothetical protein IAR50_007344 [Cryptococcus sp. DSM 104548]